SAAGGTMGVTDWRPPDTCTGGAGSRGLHAWTRPRCPGRRQSRRERCAHWGGRAPGSLGSGGARCWATRYWARGPRGRGGGGSAGWIEAINTSGGGVVSVDVPSGLDADSGHATGACVRATVTVTLGLPKPGLLTAEGPDHAGEVWVADIGVPFEAYRAIGVEVAPQLFATQDRFQLAAVRP